MMNRMRRMIPVAALGLFVLAFVSSRSTALAETTAPGGDANAHDFSFMDIDGAALPLSQYRGQVLLVVNTASQCGFTYQYEGLQELWSAYRDRGLVVLGVPSNDFGGQEPGKEAEIKKFCEVTFGVDFPLTEKVSVSGGSAHPFYAWARGAFGEDAVPRWNFHKILVGQDGGIIAAFPSSVTPMDAKITALVEDLLPEGVAAP